MTILSKHAILAVVDAKTHRVDVPEWGGAVFVRTMSAADRIELTEAFSGPEENNASLLILKVAAATICDEAGQRLFTNDDVVDLGKKSFTALKRVYDVAADINGLRADAVDAAKND